MRIVFGLFVLTILSSLVSAQNAEGFWFTNTFPNTYMAGTPGGACSAYQPILERDKNNSAPMGTSVSVTGYGLTDVSPTVKSCEFSLRYSFADGGTNTVSSFAQVWEVPGPCDGEKTDDVCDDKDESPKCCDERGNPIHGLTGEKYQKEVFFTSSGNFPLTIAAYYATRPIPGAGAMDGVWKLSNTQNLLVDVYDDKRIIQLIREDTSRVRFDSVPEQGPWVADSDILYQLEDIIEIDDEGESSVVGYKLTTPEDTVELYDFFGYLQQVTNREGLSHYLDYDESIVTISDQFGNSITYTRDASGKVISALDPDGHEYRFDYGVNGQLAYVSFPDLTPNTAGPNPFGEDNPFREYHYEDPNFTQALTGITDENGDRFATWAYDSSGYAISSEHANGVEKVDLDFSQIGKGLKEVSSTSVLGKQTVTTFTDILGRPHTTQSQRLASSSSPAATQTFTYDANGFMTSKTD